MVNRFTSESIDSPIKLPHIPISRYESGSAFPRYIETNYEENKPGSLALDVSEGMRPIVRDNNILKELDYYNQINYINDNIEPAELLEKVWNTINQEHEDDFDKLLLARKKLASKDGYKDKDFKEIIQKLKIELKKK